ncbi:MAG: PqqD family peptide modification chaperone [Parasporobacterium sp.]|nr:PqqD family peptide modification chaperone [Parasporobacterium sp.]
MEMVLNKTFDKAYSDWRDIGDCVRISTTKGDYLLNMTSSIVWKMLDGVRNGESIIDSLYEMYSDNNPKDYLEELYMESISTMIKKGIIKEIGKEKN